MRPLVVILLLLAAVLGVVLFMFNEDSAPGQTATPEVVAPEPSAPAQEPADLAPVQAPVEAPDRVAQQAPANVESDDLTNRSLYDYCHAEDLQKLRKAHVDRQYSPA